MAETGKDAFRFSHLGIMFALVIGGFAYGGNWLDTRFDTSPLFLFLGTFLGFAGGFYLVYAELFLKGKERQGPNSNDEPPRDDAGETD